MSFVPPPRFSTLIPGVGLVGVACLVGFSLPWPGLVLMGLGALLVGLSFPMGGSRPSPLVVQAPASPPPATLSEADQDTLAELCIAVDRREAALRQAQAQVHELEDQLTELRRDVDQWRRLAGEAAEVAQVKVGEELASRRVQVEQLRRDNLTREEKLRQLGARVQALTEEKSHFVQELESRQQEKTRLLSLMEQARTQGMAQYEALEASRRRCEELEAELEQLHLRVNAHTEVEAHIHTRAQAELEQTRGTIAGLEAQVSSLEGVRRRAEGLQMQVEELSSTLELARDPSSWLAAVGLAFVKVSADGWVEAASPEFEVLLALPDGGVGLDEWSFGVEVLAPRCESPLKVIDAQAELLDPTLTWWSGGMILLDGTSLLRLVLPVQEGGRLELFVPLPDRGVGEEIQSSFARLEQTLSSPAGGPSPLTTLQAVLRQLEDLGPVVALDETGQAGARLSTARVLLDHLAREPGAGPLDPQVRACLRQLRELLYPRG